MSNYALNQTTASTPARGRTARRAALAATLVFGIFASGAEARAQSAPGTFEVRPFVGAFVPTGQQRDFLKDAVLVGAQLSWVALSDLALTGTFGWSPSKDRITSGDQTLDIYQYDVGAEWRAVKLRAVPRLTPFLGLGAGGRTYDYRDLDVDAKTDFAGYGALGGDVDLGPVGVRIEARDYVSQFKPLTGGDTKTRNDIGLALGLSYRF